MSITTQDATDLFREVVDALNDREFDRFAAAHAADVVLHDHDETVHGIDAVISHEQAIYEAFPDMRYEIESVVAQGDRVVGRWTVTGTHEGEFEGIAPTGEAVAILALGELTIEDGQITEIWLVSDRLGLLAQLGAVDPPAG